MGGPIRAAGQGLTTRMVLALPMVVIALAACSAAPSEPLVATATALAVKASPAPTATRWTPKTPTPILATPWKPKTPTPAAATLEPSGAPEMTGLAKAATRTPAPAAQCPPTAIPSEADWSAVDFSRDQDDEVYSDKVAHAEENSLAFLDKFGPGHLVAALERAGMIQGRDYAFQDLTNDGVKDLAMGVHSFYIFGCDRGKYVTLLTLPWEDFGLTARIKGIQDANRDGIPELLLLVGVLSQGGTEYDLIGWDGARFRRLLCPDWCDFYVEAEGGRVYSEDRDGDGIREYVVFSGLPGYGTVLTDGLPWRYEWTYYKWDGTYYVFSGRDLSAPVYRFQAVMDGDRLTLYGRYDEALESYQNAIFSDELDWWTAQRREQFQEFYSYHTLEVPAPTPSSLPDPNEYPNLAAYSRYRIMLLHLLRGWEAEARTVYDTLRAKYADGAPGHAYAEMAAAFWEEYQTSNSIEKACGEAIQYATEHQEDVLHYVGADFFGWQSPLYFPEDVCPFK